MSRRSTQRKLQRKRELSAVENPQAGETGYMTWRKARDLAERGWVVAADGGEVRPGCLLRRVQPEARESHPLPPGPLPPGPPTDASTSHGDSLGGTRYSSNRETPANPVNVWYLKDLLGRDRWLFQLSILDNLGSA